MGESLITVLSMENRPPSTLLSMDSSGGGSLLLPSSAPSLHQKDCDRELMIQHPRRHISSLSRPPDINLPLSVDPLPLPAAHWGLIDTSDIADIGDAFLNFHRESICVSPVTAGARKCAKRGDSIWGAWFFFNYYFKPALSEKSKVKKSCRDPLSVLDKTDLQLDVFMVQHDMENMYMWVFKERPENALGKMQLRSFMNGHSRLGEPQFPFSPDKGFIRSHRMQRKQYRGLSNPQCVHGIEIVSSPNLATVSEMDRKKWVELTGRDLNYAIPPEASDYGTWRNLPITEFEYEKPPSTTSTANTASATALKSSVNVGNSVHSHPRRILSGSSLNLLTQPSSHASPQVDGLDHFSPQSNKRRKNFFGEGCSPMDAHQIEPTWINEFSGAMRHVYGPVTAAKSIYEDDEGYLIMVSLPFSDHQTVKVSWKNQLTHGVLKISCASTARMPYITRHDRTFKLTDPCPEHCPPGEFTREIALATRIPEDAKLEAYYSEAGTVLEIMVPKNPVGSEEHEVHVCLRPLHHLGGANELLFA